MEAFSAIYYSDDDFGNFEDEIDHFMAGSSSSSSSQVPSTLLKFGRTICVAENLAAKIRQGNSNPEAKKSEKRLQRLWQHPLQ